MTITFRIDDPGLLGDVPGHLSLAEPHAVDRALAIVLDLT